MAEFTGERVIPGKVDADLWNEHFSRYAFAARLARNRRVLDIACGSGYGSAELANYAARVTGVDIAEDAITYARENFQRHNLHFQQGSATALNLPEAQFDLVVAFEVVEHLVDWPSLFTETQRLLSPAGQFVVSTPNRLYYAESRKQSGPNPFHEHEFEFEEFRSELARHFPYVALYVQNHSAAITFQPVETSAGTDVRAESHPADPATAHFFVAVCAMVPQMGAPTFLYVPTASNVLREREIHIGKLEEELRTKSDWLDRSLAEHRQLVELHTSQTVELEKRNRWAASLDQQLTDASARVVQLQEELAREQAAARDTIAHYETVVEQLNTELNARTDWAQETETRLTADLAARNEEFAKCVDLLHQAEALVEERTNWALNLQAAIDGLQTRVSSVAASRWYRIGRTLGMGPEIRNG